VTRPHAIIPDGMQGYVEEWNMSPGILVDGFLFLTGMTGAGPGGTVDPDPALQIRRAFQRVEAVLQEAGLGFEHMVEMTSYHVGISDHIDVFRAIRSEYVCDPYPAWTAIEVAGFVTPGTLCELRVVARAKAD
jgi:enamine deaminase RidA (YjgF/YER057c/UK114 family)